MNNAPPLSEFIAPGVTGVLSPGWSNWVYQLFRCLPWKQGFNITATIDFANTAANTQTSATVTVTGTRQGDAVQVTPLADVPGIFFTGAVTANDTVTVYCKNFSTGAVNPASQIFRILVIQN